MPDLRLGNVFQLPCRRISRRWTRSGTNLVIFLEALCAQTNLFWREMKINRGSGRVFSGFGIWPKYGAGIGKTINILTGSGIWLFPGNRDSPKIGHGMRDLCLCVCREWRKPSRPTGSSGQSELTRRALSGVSFQTKHPMECLVNRS